MPALQAIVEIADANYQDNRYDNSERGITDQLIQTIDFNQPVVLDDGVLAYVFVSDSFDEQGVWQQEI